MLSGADAGVLAIWRGKPLLWSDRRKPAFLPFDHPVFALADEEPIFLGLDDGKARFARDISNWEPIEVPDTVGAFLDPSEQAHPDTDDAVFAELRANMTRLSPRGAELVATAKAILGWHETHGFCARCGAKTEVGQAGWQRDCPACGAHHFPRTDPVVIMLITRGNACLLGRSPGWPEGMYSCLAGFIEPGETVEAAVRREVMEETGVEVGPVSLLTSQPWPWPSSLMLGCHGEATSEAITIDPVEIEAAQWVSRERLADAFAGLEPGIVPARRGSIANHLLRNWLADRLE